MNHYEELKRYLNTKYEYLAEMGKYNLPEREGMECEYQWRLMIDIMEYVDKLEQLDSSPLTLVSDGKS